MGLKYVVVHDIIVYNLKELYTMVARLSDEIVNEIYRLNEEGVKNLGISKYLNISQGAVARYLAEIGFKSPYGVPKKDARWVDGEHKICTRCEETLHVREFLVGRKGKPSEYIFRHCKKCQLKNRNTLRSTNLVSYMSAKYQGLKSNAKKKGREVTISSVYLLELFNFQKGRCAYTGRDLVTQAGVGRHPDSCSVDRIDNTKGYVPGNILFCCNRSNQIKATLSEKELKYYLPDMYKKLQRFKKRLAEWTY